jgi:hypothetical protein
MITGTGRKSWVQISSRIIWMFRIPNYIAVWKNEIETSLKARLKFPKRKWIDTSLFSNRRPETSLYKKTAKGGVASIQKTKETRILPNDQTIEAFGTMRATFSCAESEVIDTASDIIKEWLLARL